MTDSQGLHLDTTIVASSDQVFCDLADDAIVLSLREGAYYSLNPIAAHVWTLLQEPCRVDAIREDLLATYDVEPDRCTADLLKLVRELEESGLVDRVADPVAVED